MTLVYNFLLKGWQKYDTSKEWSYSLMFISKKHRCKHDEEYKKG